jgi:uncharacterized membrane protein YphA (DoxX/SURF4 family)
MKRYLLAAGRMIVGVAFVWAGVSKAADLRTFAEEIANYQILPASMVSWLAAVLPGIELFAGALLIVGYWVRPAALVTSGMLAVFIVALSQALARGINLRCGCFGGADMATWGTVGRDVLLWIPALAALWWGGGVGAMGDERVAEAAAPASRQNG